MGGSGDRNTLDLDEMRFAKLLSPRCQGVHGGRDEDMRAPKGCLDGRRRHEATGDPEGEGPSVDP